MSNVLRIFLLTMLLHPIQVFVQETPARSLEDQKPDTKGPERGRLLLLGGGITKHHAELIKKFAGGEKAKIIVIPTAYSDREIAKDPTFKNAKHRLKKLGISNITIIHTRDRDTANSEAFTAPIKKAGGLLLLGGRTQRITSAYLNTKTHTAITALLNRGGIIAGVSAGSGVQATYFSDTELETGFEFLKGVIVMNHFLTRNKPFKHIEALKKHRDKIAIGIDDNTGILVQGKHFEVIGQSYVAIYDGTLYDSSRDTAVTLPENSERFYLLKNGDRYHLGKREVESNKRLTPIALPAEQLSEYKGTYKAAEKDFRITLSVSNDTLMLTNSWGWTPYPIFPNKKDVFYAVNRTMWFQFVRDPEKGTITGVKKMKSALQENVIVELKKIKSPTKTKPLNRNPIHQQ